MSIIAYDPGMITGFAILKNSSTILDMGVIRKPKEAKEIGEILSYFSGEAAALLKKHPILHVYVEQPVIYNKLQQKGDPNQILRLSQIAAALTMGCTSTFVTPRQWKGTTPKHISHSRILDIFPEAKYFIDPIPKTQREHAIDALGLAHWAIVKGAK